MTVVTDTDFNKRLHWFRLLFDFSEPEWVKGESAFQIPVVNFEVRRYP